MRKQFLSWYFVELCLTKPVWAVYSSYVKLRVVHINDCHLIVPQNRLENLLDAQMSDTL